jgi:hypothetical protein
MEVNTMNTTKYFPKASYLEAGAEAPEGTIVKQCDTCKQNFAVSADYADATTCELCAEAAAKAQAVSDMKANTDKFIAGK